MHYIQKKILDSLRRAPEQKYSNLMIDGVESGHFRYHLHELEKSGLVAKKDRGVYVLTSKGSAELDKTSIDKVVASRSPKLITYTLLKSENGYHLHRKDKEPYLGLLNMIGGKVHLGEEPTEASVREVREKTRLTIEEPELKGVFDIQISSNDEIYTHAVAFVFVSEIDSTDDCTDLELIDDLGKRDDLAPDLQPIVNSLGNELVFGSLKLDYRQS